MSIASKFATNMNIKERTDIKNNKKTVNFANSKGSLESNPKVPRSASRKGTMYSNISKLSKLSKKSSRNKVNRKLTRFKINENK